MRSFLLVTTRDLPEAYFLARALEARAQRFAILNLVRRPLARQMRVMARLRRNRGSRYLADFLLGRALHALERHLHVNPFPEVDGALIARIEQRHPRLDCLDPHGSPALGFVERFAPDHILLAGAPVLKPALYGMARQSALNRHLGLLPESRGSDCAIWALAMNRPESVGFSIHVVSEKVDAGDIIARQHVPIPTGASFAAYLALIQRRASEAFVALLERIIRNEPLERHPQGRLGAHFPPAGLSTIRRAVRNYARLADRPAVEPSASPVPDSALASSPSRPR
ncbi:MAG: formyltransferase family protein [Candidatus Rokuibacteriota bacterium]